MKVGLPKGTRDFGPNEIYKRQYIFSIIKKYFRLYGFAPIETPAMENLSVLMGKYGEEGDQLLFKVLNNGDYLSKVSDEVLQTKDSQALTKEVSKRGLKYDLTIPFARYVVMHRNEINLPFKRYQIQPVWRADRPQKGRYQEFYQCDADIIGSESLQYEAELIQLYDEVFKTLKLPVEIRLNNRKLLTGLAEKIGAAELLNPITVAIDKIDKIGKEGVSKILTGLELSAEQIDNIFEFLELKDLAEIKVFFQDIEIGMKGHEELTEILSFLSNTELENELIIDSSLARGLNYYTGAILEVKAKNSKIGSIGGGGRYDNLTAAFGGENLGGIGVSFGAERIYDVLEENQLFPAEMQVPPVIILTQSPDYHQYGFQLLQQLRKNEIISDLYPAGDKMKKQFKYANNIGAKYVIIIGEEEMSHQLLSIKNMETGEQSKGTLEEITSIILS
ncbi:histidine--tRNA ligase [Membranihabitans marinus]|uniref:histidine--tRNA ligase n=1 Tax=Membranihabitans marinus TaxID=1227546 RepID=UPI001F006C76|nr:histidine--tRNA ligase [Membranihabitans marinus]